jgi:NMD protein affecting ribosome stability and mRNA decay
MKTRGMSRRPRADVVHAEYHVLPREATKQRHARGMREPVRCQTCGSLYLRRTWRAGARSRRLGLLPAEYDWCPACREQASAEYFGRLRVLRPLTPEVETEVRRRVANVERRARHTQPSRRLMRIDRFNDRLEIMTTSQQLAHRIGHELKKAFGGRVRYVWTDRENALDASWLPPVTITGEATRRTGRRAT